jgi:hypothetical protein
MLFHALTLVAMTGLVGRPTAMGDGQWTNGEGARDACDWDAGERRRCVAQGVRVCGVADDGGRTHRDHQPRHDTPMCVRWGKWADGCGTAALGPSR